jgi:hypothetical protein
MSERYKKLANQKFRLNPHVLSYIALFAVRSGQHMTYCTDDFTLSCDMLYEYAVTRMPKLVIRSNEKPSMLTKLLNKRTNWTGYSVDISSMPDRPDGELYDEDYLNHYLNYKLIPSIHSDYSWLSEIDPYSIPTQLWVELFKLNKGLPPFLVPASTVDNFTKAQLKEIVQRAPRIVIEWEKSELFNLDMDLPITEVYTFLDDKQKRDQSILASLGFENHHLIPASLNAITSLDKHIESSTQELSEIYHLLCDDLRLKHWKDIAHKYNLSFIPDHSSVEECFEHLTIKTIFEHAARSEYPSIDCHEMHPILKRNFGKLIETLVHLTEIGFDPKLTEEHHTHWKDGIDTIYLESYEDLITGLSSAMQSAINDSGMVGEYRCLVIDSDTVRDFRKALHYNQLQEKVPSKPAPAKKKNKL